MTITKGKAGALFFLALAMAYGYFVGDIPLLPGDDMEPINARTLPKALAWMLGVVAFLQLVLPEKDPEEDGNSFLTAFKGLNWTRAISLGVLMIAYGMTIKLVGFLISTSIFLMLGFWILGERRIHIILLASVPVVAAFWYILSKLLGIYLAPGIIAELLGLG